MKSPEIECEELLKRVHRAILLFSSTKTKDRVGLPRDIRNLILDILNNETRHCRFDESTRFDLAVALGDKDKMKKHLAGKFELVRQAVIDGDMAKATRMMDRPIYITMELNNLKLLTYLISSNMFSDMISIKNRTLLRNKIMIIPGFQTFQLQRNLDWYQRYPHYLGEAIKLGYHGAAKAILDMAETLDNISAMINTPEFYQLVLIAKNSPFADIHKRLLDEYKELEANTIEDGEPQEDIEFYETHPTSELE